jgi:glutamyl-tRNA reductase
MDLIVTGLSHKSAPLEIREKLAFSTAETMAFLQELRKQEGVREALLLSTCNRTELYVCLRRENLDRARWLQEFLMAHKKAEGIEPDTVFYSHDEAFAVEHLFRVAGGLDSMALGEPQIFGQVKDAYHFSCETRTSGVILNKLMHWAFRVGKRTRTETDIGAGAVSISGAAAELALKIFKDLSNHAILLVGAGETGQLTAESLREKGAKRLLVANRSPEKAVALSTRMNGRSIPWESLDEALEEADLVVTCTASEEPVLDHERLRRAMGRRNHRPLLIIDIAVPRDVDPRAGKISDVFLHNIDDLQAIINRNQEKRQAEAAKAAAIVAEETDKFLRWHRTLSLPPIIKGLRDKMEEIRLGEIEKIRRRLSPEQIEELDKASRAMMNKILNTPMEKLREFSEDSQVGMARLDTVREVFGLEEIKDSDAN